MVTTARIRSRLLPSISMPAAFDATARTSRFSAPAREPGLTHGAISRQVSCLELKLGGLHFDRTAQGESLTGNGELCDRGIRALLSTLQSASSRPRASPIDNILNLDEQALVSEKGLYLVTPETRTEYRPVAAFRARLLESIESEKAETARRSV